MGREGLDAGQNGAAWGSVGLGGESRIGIVLFQVRGWGDVGCRTWDAGRGTDESDRAPENASEPEFCSPPKPTLPMLPPSCPGPDPPAQLPLSPIPSSIPFFSSTKYSSTRPAAKKMTIEPIAIRWLPVVSSTSP